jgi:proteasome accessory factor B
LTTPSDDVLVSRTQRWLDLIAFLVTRRLPVAADEIMAAVPSYAGKWRTGSDTDRATVRRMFERDKDELRGLGVPIRSVPYTIDYGAEQTTGYRLSGRDFYLPYLRVLREGNSNSDSNSNSSSRVGRVEITEEQAVAALDALHRVAALPGAPFTDAARSAVRKLAYDLDLQSFAAAPVLYVDPPGGRDLRAEIRALLDAVRARKRASFTYHGIYRGETTERTVHPYGLLFHHGRWYLVGHDELRSDLRVFRLGRMEDLVVNSSAMKTPDYQIPDSFDLSGFAGREAWELGDDTEPVTARVRFEFPTSLLADRNDWGVMREIHDRGVAVREFTVHQVEPFLRWVLSQAGEASVVGPPELVEAYDELVAETAALYSCSGAGEGP